MTAKISLGIFDKLVGLPLSGFNHWYSDSFYFGSWVEVTNDKSETIETTDARLLVYCPWQISRGKQFFSMFDTPMGQEGRQALVDLLRPYLGEPTESESNSLTDIEDEEQYLPLRIENIFFERMDRGDLAVLQVEAYQNGAISLKLTHKYVLTVLPVKRDLEFHWGVHATYDGKMTWCRGPKCVIGTD